jgi:diguanylate cyclase (GGDEF)-like protein/PAS domain S-box-containing protein
MAPTPEIPLDNLLALMQDVVCVVDHENRFIYVSPAAKHMFGYEPEEMLGRHIAEFVHPEDLPQTHQVIDQIMSGLPSINENRYIRKDGEIVYVHWSAIWSEADGVRVGVGRDITKRKQAEMARETVYAISEAANTSVDLPALYEQIHRLIKSLIPATNFFVALYDSVQDRLDFPYFVDEQHDPPEAGPLDESTRSAEVIRSGKALLMNAGDEDTHGKCVQADVGNDSQSWLGVPLKSESRILGVVVVQSYSPETHYSETDRNLLQFVSTQIATAIEHRTMLSRLEHLAEYDTLTNLPNRKLLEDRMQTGLARARRGGSHMGVLFLDLDKFKEINDTLGHDAGDLILCKVAKRMTQNMRASDTVARMGGDEFVVIMEGLGAPEDAVQLAQKLITVLAEPFEIQQQRISVTPSIGAAVYPVHGEETSTLIKAADQAMYQSKESGGNRVSMAKGRS